MTIVGSKFPALLKDTNGLIETTKNALVLSRAAGMDAGGAASALTTILNQFTLNAQASVDVINALAAASQAGSADIGYLTTAIEKSGSQAKSSGINYVQLIAMIEAVAPYFSSADVAGTQLASTLLALAVQTNSEFTPSIQGAAQAFENLAKAELTDKQMKDLVGASNITMLRALIQTREEQQRLAGEITGTNTAYEQMQIKQETLSAKMQGLKNTWDNLLLSIGNTEAFKACIDGIKDLLGWLDKLISKSSVKVGDQEIFEQYRGYKKTAKEFAKNAQSAYRAQKKQLESNKSARVAKYKADKAASKGASQKDQDRLLVEYAQDIEKIDKALEKLESDRQSINKKIRQMRVSELSEEVSKLEKKKAAYKKAGASQQSIDEIDQQIKAKQKGINKTLGFQGGQTTASNVKVPVAQTINVAKTPTVKVKPQVQPITSADIAKIVPPQGLPFKATPEIPQYSIKAINEKIASLRAELEVQPIASNRYNQLKREIDELEDKKHPVVIQPIVAPAQIGWDQITSYDDSFFPDPNEDDERKRKLLDDINTISEAFSQLGNSVQELGSAFELPELNYAGILLTALAQLAMSFTTALMQAASLGPIGWAAFAITGAATVATVAAQLKNVSKMATGGIIGGSRTIGDYNIARVNSGEMILNGTQQKRLFAIANGIGAGNDAIGGGTVRFEISGDNLAGVLNNHNAKRRRVM